MPCFECPWFPLKTLCCILEWHLSFKKCDFSLFSITCKIQTKIINLKNCLIFFVNSYIKHDCLYILLRNTALKWKNWKSNLQQKIKKSVFFLIFWRVFIPLRKQLKWKYATFSSSYEAIWARNGHRMAPYQKFVLSANSNRSLRAFYLLGSSSLLSYLTF